MASYFFNGEMIKFQELNENIRLFFKKILQKNKDMLTKNMWFLLAEKCVYF